MKFKKLIIATVILILATTLSGCKNTPEIEIKDLSGIYTIAEIPETSVARFKAIEIKEDMLTIDTLDPGEIIDLSQEQTFAPETFADFSKKDDAIEFTVGENNYTGKFENNQKTLIIYYNNELIQILAKP